jgi:DNA-3-methyladenine glycosylase
MRAAAGLSDASSATALEDPRLAAGPGRLCRALDITRARDGADLCSDERLWIEAPLTKALTDATAVVQGPRVGVAYAGAGWSERAWRFGLRGHASSSRPFPRGGGERRD